MRTRRWIAVSIGAMVVVTACLAGTTQVMLPATPLFALERPQGLGTGVYAGYDRRSFEADGRREDMDLRRAGVHLGIDVLPFLHVAGRFGYGRAERSADQSAGGREWGFEGYARLFDIVVRDPDLTYGAERVIFGVAASYRDFEADFAQDDFSWDEWRVMPMFTYSRDLRATGGPWITDVKALSTHLGLVYADLRGDLGTERLVGRRDFAFLAGLDLLWRRGWVTRLSGIVYDQSDRELGLQLGYMF